MPQPLSTKEQSLFRQVVKFYESKQYKKGIKAAEQILRKTPNHGDTQAMQALLLNSLGQGEEAFALAKTALRNDMKSHVCWHVYGLLWRSVKNFDEAIKAYRFALRLEPTSAQILRDLALLQAQMRDTAGYLASRAQMLQERPQVRQHWTAVAVAHHMAGDLPAAEKVLRAYEDTLKTPPPRTDIEHAEAVLYRNTLIAEMGETERALQHLDEVADRQLDRTAVMEMRAKYLLQLGRKEEAEKAYRALIERNSEYRAYYEGLEKAMGLDRSMQKELKELYGAYAQKYDRLDAARRIPLDFLDGSDFKDAADHYLRRMLQKGVPSTFNNVKALYTDNAKRETIEELVESYSTEKQTNGNASEAAPDGDHKDHFAEAVLYFLAQHYNYKLSRNLKKAMQLTDRLIEMSPKTYDYVMTKARVAKHNGNTAGAAKLMNEARELDLKDRYINTKCAKYQLRDNQNRGALETMSKFTRNETVGGTLGDLVDMQCMWYLTEDGAAYARQQQYGLALKRYHAIHDIFETWQEDQFDFHNFSFRKGQIRAYMAMLKWEDGLREHPYYVRAAVAAVRIYIVLHDHPDMARDGYIPGLERMSEADAKKAQKNFKKDKERAEKEDAERIDADKKAAAKKANASADEGAKKLDTDLRGRALVETKDPLGQAMRFLQPLMDLGVGVLDAQHVGFEVYTRRDKHYLALKCLVAAFSLSKDDPTTHYQAMRFLQILQATKDTALAPLAASSLPAPYNVDAATADLPSMNAAFLAAHPASLPHAVAFVQTQRLLDPSSSSSSSSSPALDEPLKCLDESSDLEEVVLAVQDLRTAGVDREAMAPFLSRAAEIWPDASVLARAAGVGP